MNGKTIKQIADELNVSKPTVTKAIELCCLSDSLTRVGNRYELTEEQAQLVKSQISQVGESSKAKKTSITQSSESPTSQYDMEISQKETQNSIISLLQGQLELLQQQLTMKDAQLTVKDEQLAAKDKQIGDLTAALLSSQEQHKALTDALTAAQALHAGTIQERLTAQADPPEGQSEVMTAETVSDLDEGELARRTQQEKQGFLTRIFGKRKKG